MFCAKARFDHIRYNADKMKIEATSIAEFNNFDSSKLLSLMFGIRLTQRLFVWFYESVSAKHFDS